MELTTNSVAALTTGAAVRHILLGRSGSGLSQFTAARIEAFAATIDRHFGNADTPFNVFFSPTGAYFTLPADDPFSPIGPRSIMEPDISPADASELDEDTEAATGLLEHCTHIEHGFDNYTPIHCTANSVTVDDVEVWRAPRSTGEAIGHILCLGSGNLNDDMRAAIGKFCTGFDRIFASNTRTLMLVFTDEGAALTWPGDTSDLDYTLPPEYFADDQPTLTFTDERVEADGKVLWQKPV